MSMAPPNPGIRSWDRVEGMLLGLAIGDSLGNTSESQVPAQRRQRYREIRDYLPNAHAEGRAVVAAVGRRGARDDDDPQRRRGDQRLRCLRGDAVGPARDDAPARSAVVAGPDDPEEALVRAVNDTRDNDTVGAIVGAAVGALHGTEALPDRWRRGLLGRTRADDDGRVFELIEKARHFAAV